MATRQLKGDTGIRDLIMRTNRAGFKKDTIRIKLDDGAVNVVGLTLKGLTVHKADVSRLHNVTHKRSGLMIAQYTSQMDAKVAAFQMTMVTDWTVSAEALKEIGPTLSALRSRLRFNPFADISDLKTSPSAPKRPRSVRRSVTQRQLDRAV